VRAQRILVLALDGLDPSLFARFSDEGLLPHLTRLQREGTWGKLVPVYPPVSPVIWTSFLTGLPPVAHGVLDFVTKARGEYHSTVGLYRVVASPDGLFRYYTRRSTLTLFQFLPPGNDFCLWLPATFPAESPPGRMLSGLGAPDLLATLGTSALYTTHPSRYASSEPGYVHRLEPSPAGWQGQVLGPGHTSHAFSLHQTERGVRLRLGGGAPTIVPSSEWSPWLEPHFPLSGHLARGLCRFKLLRTGEELAMYRTPLWCHPLDPLYPLSQPPELSGSLATELGPYPTAGFAGDQLALRQGLIERSTYLEDAYALWDAQAAIARRLVGDREGWRLAVIHFMTADALQHLFWRDYDPLHPAHDPHAAASWSAQIGRGYHWLDTLVDELVALAGPDTLVVVLSDHGVVPLYWRVDINGWLHQQGCLTLRGEQVDWAASRAFAFGHGGIWLNLAGRERRGCVSISGYEALRTQLVAALRTWRDPGTGTPVVRAVWRWEASRLDRDRGLPLPDIGFALTPGYGLERRNLVGRAGMDQQLIRPNHGAWSGGHEGPYRPADVPGLLVLHGPGIPAGIELQNTRIVDLAPTLLRCLGAQLPLHLEGRPLLAQTP
jgi:predicted AlkP superfamily phosphohydrolase/phosphomutase